MKKLNLLGMRYALIIACLFSIQSLFAVDVPLKSADDPNAYTPSRPIRTRIMIPLTATIEGSELGFYYTTNVGTCTVTVVDENNNVEFVQVINTSEDTEFYFDLQGLPIGNHYVKINYGSINLIGKFYLAY